MVKKNRFSLLLEQLLDRADVKQCVLANALNYDTSLISKWLNGHVVPKQKGIDEVLTGISKCIVEKGSPEGLNKIGKDYQLVNMGELERALYDHLVLEYNYVVNLSAQTGESVAPNLVMFSELSLADYLRRMKHPVLRHVSSLRIVSAVDLMALSKEYQLEFTNLRIEQKEATREYPNVKYNLIIDLHEESDENIIERVMLLTNMMIKMVHIRANIYSSDFASGKAIFAVRDEFAISGMLHGNDRCISVVVCEGDQHSTGLYRLVDEVCTNDNLCFFRKEITDMIQSKEYFHILLESNQSWLIGSISEHFLPDTLFSELIETEEIEEEHLDPAALQNLNKFLSAVCKSNPIRMLIHEKALSEFALKGDADFFNRRITLDFEKRRQVLEYIGNLLENSQIDMRMIHGTLPEQTNFLPLSSAFITDNSSLLKVLNTNLMHSRIFQVNRPELDVMYRKFYNEIWNFDDSIVIREKSYIRNYIQQLLKNVEFLSFSDF